MAGPRFSFDMSMSTLGTSRKVAGGRPVLGPVCKPFQVHLLGCSELSRRMPIRSIENSLLVNTNAEMKHGAQNCSNMEYSIQV